MLPSWLRASASIITAPVPGSNDVLLSCMAEGPGFRFPLSVVPSHFRSRVTGFRCSAVGPQSPDQMPLTASVEAAGATPALLSTGSVADPEVQADRANKPVATHTENPLALMKPSFCDFLL